MKRSQEILLSECFWVKSGFEKLDERGSLREIFDLLLGRMATMIEP